MLFSSKLDEQKKEKFIVMNLGYELLSFCTEPVSNYRYSFSKSENQRMLRYGKNYSSEKYEVNIFTYYPLNSQLNHRKYMKGSDDLIEILGDITAYEIIRQGEGKYSQVFSLRTVFCEPQNGYDKYTIYDQDEAWSEVIGLSSYHWCDQPDEKSRTDNFEKALKYRLEKMNLELNALSNDEIQNLKYSLADKMREKKIEIRKPKEIINMHLIAGLDAIYAEISRRQKSELSAKIESFDPKDIAGYVPEK